MILSLFVRITSSCSMPGGWAGFRFPPSTHLIDLLPARCEPQSPQGQRPLPKLFGNLNTKGNKCLSQIHLSPSSVNKDFDNFSKR